MAEIITFVPRAGMAAAENMAEFVRLCRQDLTVFGANLNFDDPTWDVSDHYFRRGGNGGIYLQFSEDRPKLGTLGLPMPEPLGMQAKAYIRYQAGVTARRSPPLLAISAFRALLAAFRDRAMEPDLGLVDSHLLDHAVRLASEKKGGDFGPRIGTALSPISKFLREKNLAVHAPIDWRHGRRWQSSGSIATGKEAEERRQAKLPSLEALRALPEAFLAAKEPRDVITTSVLALLTCAPSRINEIFALASECKIQPLTEGEDGYMLRWAGSKGYHDFAKGIPAVMADVAASAISRIKEHTVEAREMAAWYEQHPDRLYLPNDCSHLRGENLSGADIAQIIGLADAANGRDWAIDRKLKPIPGMKSAKNRTLFVYRFEDVERSILSLLPKGFPILDRVTGLRHSEALMVARRGEFDEDGKCRWRCMFSPVTHNNIKKRINPVNGLFVKLGLSPPDNPIIIKSHQLRHYLNTLAQRGGLTEFEIAAWSGRKDVRQNATYDHRSQEELLLAKRNRERELGLVPGRNLAVNAPVRKSDGGMQVSHGHATELGFCEHDFAASPCAMFMECLHCTEHACVKGQDPRHAERVAYSLECARKSLAEAETAMSKEYEGAREWIEAHMTTIERLEQLHAILTDPDTPDGSVIRLARSGRFSLIEQAMRDHGQTGGMSLSSVADSARAISGVRGDG